ncbi:MAG: class II aldolase/adducin family protein [Rhodospirillales bacterium]|nr:class II aldolase/adducin family protein [Rhodospirillales bacterium]
MTAIAEKLEFPPLHDQVGAEEWETRVDLAASYRLVAHYGWTHLTGNHISARVPGTNDQFLINPYGLMYEEITASSLVRVDLEGTILNDTEYTINQAGYVIHSAVHAARHDVQCVLHTHTEAGMGVSAQAAGLLPISMSALRFYERIGYHDYEGVTLDVEERDRIVADLGTHMAMILRNHGLLTCGRSIGEAFLLMYNLEKACASQLAALAGPGDIVIPPPEVCEKSAGQSWRGNHGDSAWPALVRQMDRLDPSFRQ